MREVKIVSSTFSSGGAERVLASLVNEGPKIFTAISLSKNIDYLEDDSSCECFDSKARLRLVRILAKLFFLLRHLKAGDRILLSDWTILLCVNLLNAIFSLNLVIVYRPSINAGFIEESLLAKVKIGAIQRTLMRIALKRVYYVFQSKEIESSFLPYGIRKSIVIANPLGKKKFSDFKYSETVDRCLFIGRATYEKGFDRFCRLAVNDNSQRVYEHYGQESKNFSDSIKEMGWYSTSAIDLSGALILVPSRLEGFPNIVLELLHVQANVWVSKEVAQYFKEYPLIFNNLNIVDFNNSNEYIIELLFGSKSSNHFTDLSELPTLNNYSSQILNLYK